jgi:hypothetical protein
MIVIARGTLPADVEAAWGVLTDWERQAEWMADADRVTLVSAHREGIGARVAVKTRLFGIPMFTETLEVSRWEPPSALDVAHTGPVRGAGRWRLTRRGQETDFLWVEDIRLAIPGAGELAARIYAPVMRRLMARAVTRLAGLF